MKVSRERCIEEKSSFSIMQACSLCVHGRESQENEDLLKVVLS